MRVKIANFFLILFLLSACRRWHVKRNTVKINNQINKHANLLSYELSIDGIECKECVRTILHAIKNYVTYAECICPKKDFSKTKITCFVEKKHKEFSIQKISALLAKEDFLLRNVKGTFVGTILQEENGQLFFSSSSFDDKFSLVLDPAKLATASLKLKPTVSDITLYGILQLDKKQFLVLDQN